MIPLIVLSLIIHLGCYYYVGYDFQRRHQSMSSRFAAISSENMGFWRHFCLYPKTGRNRSAYLVTYDIERLTILHQLLDLVLIVILFLLFGAGVISPLTAFIIVLFGSESIFSLLVLAVFKLGEKVFSLPAAAVSDAEKKKLIRNCIRRYPEDRFSCEVQGNQKNGLLWRTREHILHVTDRETGELITSKPILREEWYRYLEGCITTFLGKES